MSSKAVKILNMTTPSQKNLVPSQLFEPLPKQQLFQYLVFCHPTAKFVWYCGGFGSGKTYIGSQTAIRLVAQAPKGRGLIARQTAVDLKATTMKTFFEVCDPRLIYKHNKSEQLITFANGHEVYYWGLDDIERLKSLEIGWFWVDEVNEVDVNSFNVLKGRLRHKAQPKRVGMVTSNSEGKNWTYKQFVKGEGVKEEYRELYYTIKAPSNENTNLPKDYLDVLESYTGDLYERYVKASFNVFEGQIFPDFNPAIHVIEPFVIPDDWTKVRSIDHGERNPTAVLWGAVSPNGNLYIYREYQQTQEFVDYHAKQVADLSGGEEYSYTLIDPSVKSVRGSSGRKVDTEWKEEMAKYEPNFNLVYANNSVEAGFARIHKYLRIDPDRVNPITDKKGSPRLFIFSSCPELIDQLEGLKWAKISHTSENDPIEKPRKRDDHLTDNLKYIVMSRPDISLMTVHTPKIEKVNLNWETIKNDKEALENLLRTKPEEVYLSIFKAQE